MIFIILLIVSIACVILFKDILPLKYEKSKKDMIVISIFALFAISISFLMAFQIKIPSPMEALDNFVTDILKLGYKK